jgi:hypothetical protein
MNARCEDHWQVLVRKYGQGSGSKRTAFTAGWISALGEKVHLGACKASMCSPMIEDFAWIRDIVDHVCAEYGLLKHVIFREKRVEFWMFRNIRDYNQLSMHPNDNYLRGRLCGIPIDEINPNYIIEASPEGAKT